MALQQKALSCLSTLLSRHLAVALPHPADAATSAHTAASSRESAKPTSRFLTAAQELWAAQFEESWTGQLPSHAFSPAIPGQGRGDGRGRGAPQGCKRTGTYCWPS